MNDFFQTLLANHHVGVLSTQGNKPEGAIIFFVYVENKICFKSRTESRHSQNILLNPHCSFSTYLHDSTYADKTGCQTIGKAKRITNPNLMEKVVLAYSKKFPGSGKKLPSIDELCSDAINSTFYEYIPEEFKIIDEGVNRNNTMPTYKDI